MESRVAVVILNWNGRTLLEEYLPSVCESLPAYAKLYVADNDSSDDSISYLEEHYPAIEIIRNDFNFGFAQGYNVALKDIREEYAVLLNSDVACGPNWIDPIIEFMDNNPKVGACQPKIKDYKNKEYFEYAGAAGGFIDHFGFPFCRGRIFNTLEKDEGQYQDNSPIFWATGACLFIRTELFKALDGFDSSFFAHMEEIDLCWRLQRMGYELYCVPKSEVFHLGGGTLKKLNPRKTYLNFRNNLLMILKNGGGKHFLFRVFVKLVLDGIAGLKFLFEGSPLHTWSVLRAHFSVYGQLGRVLKQRKSLKQQFGSAENAVTYEKSIVVDYYLRRKTKYNHLGYVPHLYED